MQKRKQFQILRITFDIRNPRRLQDKTNTKLHCQGKSTYYHWKITNPPSQLAYGYYHHPPNNIPQWCVHNFVPMCFYLHKRNFLCRSSTRNMFSKELTGFFTLMLSKYCQFFYIIKCAPYESSFFLIAPYLQNLTVVQ